MFPGVRLVLVTAAAGVLFWSAGQRAAADAPPATDRVVMEATSFTPARLTIEAGDAIVWENKDPFPHTATSKAAKFDSGSVAPGKSWKHTFRDAGKFDYVCTLHPTMKGTIVVK